MRLVGGAHTSRIRTDAGGQFIVSVPTPGAYAVTVRRIGFRAAREVELALPTRDTFELVVRLPQIAVELSELIVGAVNPQTDFWTRDFERRRARGVGVFLTRDEIDKRGTPRVSDLLIGIRGVQLIDIGFGDNLITSSRHGACLMTVYVDGMLSDQSFLLRMLRSYEIEAIEVYQAATLPASFRSMSSAGGGMCGAVVVWTRATAGRK